MATGIGNTAPSFLANGTGKVLTPVGADTSDDDGRSRFSQDRTRTGDPQRGGPGAGAITPAASALWGIKPDRT